MTERPFVLVEAKGAALWISLNRPASLNALTPEMLGQIANALDDAARNDHVRCVVLTGAGRAFCAGADLKAVRGGADTPSSDPLRAFLAHAAEVTSKLADFPKPLIAAVNGLALAGGLEIALCADLVIAARSARLGDAHANYGLLPGGGSSARLPRKIGQTRATFLLFTGDSLSADEMQTYGLVNQVVDDSDLVPAVERVVGKLALKSPLVLRRMKALIRDGMDQPLHTALAMEMLANEAHASSHDLQEGLDAFEQKRQPVFLGR
jgi:enoyl-CoA hydratase/carnithine racemase